MALRSDLSPASETRSKKPKIPRPSRHPRSTRKNERLTHDLFGIGCILVALLMWITLFAYAGAGQIGRHIADYMRLAFGIGAYMVPGVLIYAGIALIAGRGAVGRGEVAAGSGLIFLAIISWWHYGHTHTGNQLATTSLVSYGGYVGGEISTGLRGAIGVASPLIYLAVIVGCLVWTVDKRLLHILDGAAQTSKKVAGPVAAGVKSLKAKRTESVLRKAGQNAQGDLDSDKPTVPTLRLSKAARAQRPIDDEPLTILSIQEAKAAVEPFAPPLQAPIIPIQISKAKPSSTAQTEMSWDRLGEANDHVNKDYNLPSVELLSPSPPPPKEMIGSTAEKQAILMQCLNDFKIGANVQQVAVGPTVTRYEVQLEPGILVKRIVTLADNLAMSLAAMDVRVEAPIPGKSAIGIEVPNEKTQMVSIRECMETNEFINAPSKLTFALGKDVAGNYKYADLARMPHLLVGGSTNSGKSVCLNAIITSMVYRATPREVRFIMIDPKRVELSLYDGIPHLLAPVVKDTKLAAGILRSVLKEMDKRYEAFAQIGTRNLEGYNSKVTPEEKLPFIVVIIDELADLMMTQGAEVETSICRLAQLARATGIHLVIATQRPSVDVITGTIKANIASRIAFAVATQIDSRTILDMPGADRLIGRGDMLFLPIDASKPLRVQGCFVSERETDLLVSYLKDQETANYSMIPSEGSSGFGDSDDGFEDDGSGDELFEPCVRWVVTQGEASTSSLQRKFKIGYTRAARIVDTMEAKGIVGPQDGVKRREVMVAPENLDLLFRGNGQGIIPGMND